MSHYRKGSPIVTLLDTNGDGTGVFEANGDYSETPTEFIIRPEPGHSIAIHRLVVQLRNGSVLDEDNYGGIPGLTNGVYLFMADNGEDIWRFPALAAVRANRDWAGLAHPTPLVVGLAPAETLYCTLDFVKLTGVPIVIADHKNHRLGVRLNDDFTGLLEQRFVVYGVSN